MHAGFVGQAVGLAGVATDTGGHYIFPRGLPSPVAGDDMIHIQVLGGKCIVAVLAPVPIPLE